MPAVHSLRTPSNPVLWTPGVATMSARELEVEAARPSSLVVLSGDEMRLAGYSDTTPEIDVCAGNE
jgi:hypothetical protein